MADDVLQVPLFHWADYLILGLFLLFNIGLGAVIGYRDRKKNTSKDLLMAGGNMHWLPTSLSMQASFLSAVSILATPTEIYFFGTMYGYIALAYIISFPIAAYLYVPTYFKLNLVSVYEYLEIRFNKTVRICGALNFSVMLMMFLMVVLYVPSIALAQVTNLEIWVSVLICGAVCTFYTVLGGMKATIWNDFFQMLIIYGGLILVIAMGSSQLGGYSNVWEINLNGSRIIFDNFRVDPTLRTTFWTQIIGGTTIQCSMYCSSQNIIQKFLSVGDLQQARKAVWLAVVSLIAIMVLICMIGTIIYAWFVTCNPLSIYEGMKNDQLMPLFIMQLLGKYPGLPGLFLASAFSAALSSVSGSLNSLAAVFLVDFVQPTYTTVKKGAVLSDRARATITRLLILIFGVLTIILGSNADKMGSLVLQLSNSIFGFLGGPLLGLLTLGIFFPYVSSWGALAGHISSLIISSWLAIGTMVNGPSAQTLPMRTDGCYVAGNMTTFSPNIMTSHFTDCTSAAPEPEEKYFGAYKLSNMYYGIISIIVSIVVASIVSLVTGRARNTEKRLIYDCSANCCCYCPPGCTECMHCGAVVDSGEVDSEDKTEVGVIKNGEYITGPSHYPPDSTLNLSPPQPAAYVTLAEEDASYDNGSVRMRGVSSIKGESESKGGMVNGSFKEDNDIISL